MTEVLAHSMLGTASTIGSAIALAMAEESSAANRDSLLALAMTRLDFLIVQLRDLTAGIPEDLVPTVNPGRRRGDSIVEDGTG
jgi:ABC-type phosphate transport system permease subunit